TFCTQADEMLRTRCKGALWESDTCNLFALNSIANLGDLRALATLAPARLRDAEQRGDLYGATNIRVGWPNLLWLLRHDPTGAREDVTDAMSHWSWRGFH